MAYSLPFSTSVNQLIGRYAVGYPSDRIKDMMARVERIEFTNLGSEPGTVNKCVKWSEFHGPTRNMEIFIMSRLLQADCPVEEAPATSPLRTV